MSEELRETAKYYEMMNYKDTKLIIKSNINAMAGNFISIGYYLKHIRDNEMYREDGYESIWDLAQAEFGISKSQASKFMSINDRFSKDGNSPILLEQYKDFSSSKLSEMLYLNDEQLEQVTVGTTVAQIREIRKPEEVTPAQIEQKHELKDCKFGGGKCNLWMDPNTCSGKARCQSNFISNQEPEKVVSTSKQDCFIRDQINEAEEDGLKCSGAGWDECKDCDKADSEEPVLNDDLDFTVRTYNCLKRAGVDTVEQLCSMTEDEVSQVRNFALKCVTEVKEKLEELGLKLKVDDITEIVNDEPENVDKKPEIVNDVDEYETEDRSCSNCRYNILSHDEYFSENPDAKEFPCDPCGAFDNWEHEVDGLVLDCYNHEEGWHKEIISHDHEEVETVEADIIQTVPEDDEEYEPNDPETYTVFDIDTEMTSLMQWLEEFRKDNSKAPARRKSKMRWDAICLLDKQVRETNIPKDPEPEPPVQPELPILKNNDQRKEWAEKYKVWGEWYYDEHIDCHYYKYDFTNGDRLVVEEYRDREVYWSDQKRDEIFYHLLRKEKQAYGNKRTYEEKYSHSTSSMTEITDYLKEFQKK